jgi:uncharacterized protein (DUF427 family)
LRAVWKDQVIAEAPKDQLIYIEQNWYFPPSTVNFNFLRKSDTPYTCPWKGECQYYDVGRESGGWSKDGAWSYPEPKQSAIDVVHKDFSGYVVFWRDVVVEE